MTTPTATAAAAATEGHASSHRVRAYDDAGPSPKQRRGDVNP